METNEIFNWSIRFMKDWNSKTEVSVEIKTFTGTRSECIEECHRVFKQLHKNDSDYHNAGAQHVCSSEFPDLGAIKYARLLDNKGVTYMHFR